jgi:hypothetical protein
MIEWLDFGYCRGISVTVLPDISNKLSRRLSLLPFPALPAPGSQFEHFWHTTGTDASHSSRYTHCDTHTVVCKLGGEPYCCCFRNLDTRMGAPIPRHDSTTVQSTQKCAYSSVCNDARIAVYPSVHCRHPTRCVASVHFLLPPRAHHFDRH